jgi:hypothetical protein
MSNLSPESTRRAIELLKAVRDLLNKANEGPWVVDILNTTIRLDEADCDGFCVLEEIETLLAEIGGRNV